MKHYFAAAGALLLGTSTIALAADVKPLEASGAESAKIATDAKTVDAGWDKTALASKPETAVSSDAKVEFAALDKDLAKLASAETDAKFQTASPESDAKVLTASADTDAKVLTASADTDVKVETAWAETDPKVETAADGTVKTEATGMGGPLETEVATSASFAPRPADHNYPPCDPGPGDDNCIQLYEEGVRDQLASWNRPTGGLLDAGATTAMGGPFEAADSSATTSSETETHLSSTDHGVGGPLEPVDSGATTAMNGDGAIDTSAGETAASEAATGATAQSEVADHGAFTGVGGPVEAQSGYPACEPGPGADRCIQLYEAGVSGAGN